MQYYDYIIFILSLVMITIVLLQQSQDSLADAFSGEKSDLFKNKKTRGFERVLNITMGSCSTIFVLLVILSRALSK